MPSRTRGKGRAPEVVPEATLPLGKQLAHTGKSIGPLLVDFITTTNQLAIVLLF
jgi:hypothetical protein